MEIIYGEAFCTSVADDFAEYAKQGGLITMCAHMTNPFYYLSDSESYTGDAYRVTLTLVEWDQLFWPMAML